ncbi:MAG TPA: 5-formyltetrahydrofolate cyclo-ligase, partial [Candidatus Paceibacterota bacterium]|nr:5-formyltetrahydrofolate cyclo-ligase [Candidatus Paceibacterota bacterium]
GGGWYDRFLTKVPRSWLRVGFCYEHQFSSTPLLRQSWDQEMDAVIVVSAAGARLIHSSATIAS